jgi:hypothetical protein
MKNIQHFEQLRNYFFARNLKKVWDYQKDFEIGMSYSIGLILSEKKPVLKVLQNETGVQAINLSYFLQEDLRYWELEALFDKEVEMLEDDGELLLDEVVMPKENTTQMQAHIVHCSGQSRRLLGQEYLVLVWTKGNKTVVVNFLMLKKGADRLKLSIEVIEKFLKSGKKVKGLRADGCFFKGSFVRNLRKLKVGLISKARHNSLWYQGNEKIQLKKYAARISKDSFHYYEKQGVYAKSIIVANQKYFYCKVVIVKPKHNSKPDDYVYLVSTDTTMTTREIIKGYKTRWNIEVLFRDCSQNLGLKNCQAYRKASETHVAMVFLTYNFLAGIKEKEGGTIGMIKRKFIYRCKLMTTNILPFKYAKMVA